MSVIDTTIDLLKERFSDRFNGFYEGDPIEIPPSMLPAICVTRQNGRVRQDATGMDKVSGNLFIRIIFNKRDDFGATDNVDLTERRIRELVEGREADGSFSSQSVLGVVRPNITLGNSVVKSDLDWEYGVVPRSGEVDITSEAQITISVEEFVIVNARV